MNTTLNGILPGHVIELHSRDEATVMALHVVRHFRQKS
jgi:hypothetical protein